MRRVSEAADGHDQIAASPGSSPHHDHVIVIGATTTVVRLVDELERAGEDVVVVTVEPVDPGLVVELNEAGAEVIVTPAIRAAPLRQAGVARAKSVVIFGLDDVFIVRTALLVEEMNSSVRMVLELNNPSLGARLPRLLGDCQVLSSAELAAPFFVTAALATADTSTFELAGRQVVAGPRSQVGGELIVLGDTRLTGEASLLPGSGGDVVLGTQLTGSDPTTVKTSGLFGVIGYVLDRKARWVLAGVLILAVLSAVYFKLTGEDWLTALFLALATTTATGLGDVSTLAVVWRIGAVVIAGFGLLLSAGVTAVIIDALISSRFDSMTGAVRGRPRNHVVVCGLGRIGVAVCLGLRSRRVPVVAIERNENAPGVRRARLLKIPVIIAEATDPAALQTAGVSRAVALLAVTDEETANLETAMVAKELRPDLRVVSRMYDHDLANRVEHRLELGPTRSMSMLAAPAFAAAALGRRQEVIFPIGRRVVLFTEVPIQPDSPAVGQVISRLHQPGRARVLAVARRSADPAADWSWEPGGHPLLAGDRIAVAATRAGLARLLLGTRTPRRHGPPR